MINPDVVVVDIETLSTDKKAVIASIGAVIVDVYTGEVKDSFYRRCDLYQLGRVRDESTMQWWDRMIQESPHAHSEIFDHDDREDLGDALEQFNTFIDDHFEERSQVFGNGCEFDNVILEDAMRDHNISPRWDHGCNQSLRSVVWMGRLLLGYDPKYDTPFEGFKHHALHDAKHEAQYLSMIVQEFAKRI